MESQRIVNDKNTAIMEVTMARQARLTHQVVVQVREEIGAELRSYADIAGESVAEIIRQAIDSGMPAMRRKFRKLAEEEKGPGE